MKSGNFTQEYFKFPPYVSSFPLGKLLKLARDSPPY